MANSTIQLPYTATTSGNILDASIVTVGTEAVRRERMVIVDDTKTANFAALVTTSGALSVTVQSPATVVNASSGLVQVLTSGTLIISLSSVIGISSGLVTLSSNPTAGQVISLSSGTITLSSNPTVVSASSGLIQISGPVTSASSGLVQLSGTSLILSASSGFVQVYQSTAPWSIGGIVSLSSGTVVIAASSGGAIPATSSGGLGVTILGGAAGSTVVNLSSSPGISSGLISVTGSSGVIAQVTSSGGMWVQITGGGSGSTEVNIVGAGGFAPVTTSMGLLAQFGAHLIGRIDSTIGAPAAPTQITTAAGRLFSVTISATGAVSATLKLFSDTGSGSSSTGYTYFFASPGAAGLTQVLFSAGSGVAFADGGLRGAFTVGSTSTGATTAAYNGYIEYAV